MFMSLLMPHTKYSSYIFQHLHHNLPYNQVSNQQDNQVSNQLHNQLTNLACNLHVSLHRSLHLRLVFVPLKKFTNWPRLSTQREMMQAMVTMDLPQVVVSYTRLDYFWTLWERCILLTDLL